MDNRFRQDIDPNSNLQRLIAIGLLEDRRVRASQLRDLVSTLPSVEEKKSEGPAVANTDSKSEGDEDGSNNDDPPPEVPSGPTGS